MRSESKKNQKHHRDKINKNSDFTPKKRTFHTKYDAFHIKNVTKKYTFLHNNIYIYIYNTNMLHIDINYTYTHIQQYIQQNNTLYILKTTYKNIQKTHKNTH